MAWFARTWENGHGIIRIHLQFRFWSPPFAPTCMHVIQKLYFLRIRRRIKAFYFIFVLKLMRFAVNNNCRSSGTWGSPSKWYSRDRANSSRFLIKPGCIFIRSEKNRILPSKVLKALTKIDWFVYLEWLIYCYRICFKQIESSLLSFNQIILAISRRKRS